MLQSLLDQCQSYREYCYQDNNAYYQVEIVYRNASVLQANGKSSNKNAIADYNSITYIDKAFATSPRVKISIVKIVGINGTNSNQLARGCASDGYKDDKQGSDSTAFTKQGDYGVQEYQPCSYVYVSYIVRIYRELQRVLQYEGSQTYSRSGKLEDSELVQASDNIARKGVYR